ncbi:MAG: helix-turn-helix transcriptional regulator [Motilibacteraceae bacterium]
MEFVPTHQTPSGTAPAVPAATGAHAHSDVERVSRRRVARTILENGASTAAELAERLEVTPAAVRRHLDALLAEGLVEQREARSRGPRGRGRPAKAFVLTPAGRDAFDQAYDELAATALEFLAARAGEEAVREFARARVAGLAERLRPAVEGVSEDADGSERVEALAEALSGAGYAASARTTDVGGAQLCQHHCPVAHVAERFPQLCDAETEVFAELLGTHVQRLATIAHGDGVCTTHIPSTTTPSANPSTKTVPAPAAGESTTSGSSTTRTSLSATSGRTPA